MKRREGPPTGFEPVNLLFKVRNENFSAVRMLSIFNLAALALLKLNNDCSQTHAVHNN